MKKVTIFIVLAFLLLYAVPVSANDIPPLPHAFYGTVTINGSSAPPGTRVEARGEGVLTGITDNPTITTVAGIYGTSNPFQHRLIVQGDISPGATLTFYVNGVSTAQTAEWYSGETTELPLSVTIAAPPGVGAPPPAIYYIETNLFGIEASVRISGEGAIQETIEATSADGKLTITIPAGTIALDKYGSWLSTLTVSVDPSPPRPPRGAHIIGLAYDFKPDGATFDPPITLECTYDPAQVPEDVAEEDLVVAYYDEGTGKWVECECVCDPEGNCVTACVYHLTTFAIIAAAPLPPPAPAAFSISNLTVRPAEVQPKEAVTITVSVANTGGTEGSYTVVLMINGVKEAEKRVTIAAGDSQRVSFTVSKEDARSYSVVVNGLSGSFTVLAPVVVPAPAPAPPAPPPPPAPPAPPAPINWPLIGGIIAAVIVVALFIYFLVVRRILARG